MDFLSSSIIVWWYFPFFSVFPFFPKLYFWHSREYLSEEVAHQGYSVLFNFVQNECHYQYKTEDYQKCNMVAVHCYTF